MGIHHVANRHLQVTESKRALIQNAGLVLGGLLLLAALLWIGFAEDKSMAILLGIAALIAARVLYINVPELLSDDEQPDHSDENEQN